MRGTSGRPFFRTLAAACSGFLLGAALQVVAFTEPTVAPPGGNVSAPINVGPTSQDKSGGSAWITADGLGSRYGALFATVSGNVGIGTVSPAQKLDVRGDLSIGTAISGENHKFILRGPNTPANSSSYQDISYEFSAAGSAKIRAYRGGSWDTYLQFLTNSSTQGSDSPQVRMHIDQNGNVGIGTNSPAAKLEVSGGMKMTGRWIVASEGAAWSGDNFEVHTSGWAGGGANNNYGGIVGGHGYYYGGLQSGGGSGNEAGAGQLYVSGNSMLIGSVGIGTISPAHKLHVVSASVQDGIMIDAATYPEIRLDRGGVVKAYVGVAGSAGGYGAGTLADSLVLRSQNALHLISNAGTLGLTVTGGNVGIGTTGPGTKLDVQGGYIRAQDAGAVSGAFMEGAPGISYFGNLGTADVALGNSANWSSVIIKNGGNVGIGTVSPGAKLDVAGNLHVLNSISGDGGVYDSGNRVYSTSNPPPSVGVGQSWINMTGSRAFGVTYTNNTGKPIQVSVNGLSINASGNQIYLAVDGINVAFQTQWAGGYTNNVNAIVPNGSSYIAGGNMSLYSWLELR